MSVILLNKLVVCGKYKKMNKTIKIQHISPKFSRFLIFVVLYNQTAKNANLTAEIGFPFIFCLNSG